MGQLFRIQKTLPQKNSALTYGQDPGPALKFCLNNVDTE